MSDQHRPMAFALTVATLPEAEAFAQFGVDGKMRWILRRQIDWHFVH